jgi:hypothetical protein
MNKRLAKIAFLVLALPAAAAAFVWTRHAYVLARYANQRALAHQPETIETTLERIKLPPGFKIRLYALVPGARHMAVGNDTTGPRKERWTSTTNGGAAASSE